MAQEIMGGPARAQRVVVTTTGAFTTFDPPGRSKHIRIRNQSSNELRIYFTEADFTAGTHYVSLANAADPVISEAIGAKGLWFRSVGGDAVAEILVIQRFG